MIRYDYPATATHLPTPETCHKLHDKKTSYQTGSSVLLILNIKTRHAGYRSLDFKLLRSIIVITSDLIEQNVAICKFGSEEL